MDQNTDNTTNKNPSSGSTTGSNTDDQSSQTSSIEPKTINEPLHASNSSASNMNESMPSPNTESQSQNTSQTSDSGQNLPTPADTPLQQNEPINDPSTMPDVQPGNTPPIDIKNQTPSPAITKQNDQLPNVVSNKKSGSKYTIVLTILAIFAIAGIAFAGYQFYLNSQQENGAEETVSEQAREIVVFVPEIVLDNGNIVTTLADGNAAVLFDKSEFDTAGIMGFSDLIMAPDGSSFCFHTKPPAPVSAIYISDISGNNFQEVGRSRTGCRWLNSNSIAYTNTANETVGVDIYMYNMQDQLEVILTSQEMDNTVRYFSIRGVDNNGETILCSVSLSATNVDPVDCTINTQTKQVTISETLSTPDAEQDPEETEEPVSEE